MQKNRSTGNVSSQLENSVGCNSISTLHSVLKEGREPKLIFLTDMGEHISA